MHDAHVCASATYVIACAVAAQVMATAKARSARKAARAAMRVTTRAATKAANAVKVARKEAAEQYASRCARRVAAKAAAAPAVRASKRTASMVAKVVKAANALRLNAVRVARAAAKVAPVIKAAMVAIDAVCARATMVVHTTVVCVAIPMHSAHVRVYHAHVKATNKAANKAIASIRAPRTPMNNKAKRDSITLACTNARASKAAQRAADAHAIALVGSVMSQRTIAARAAQGAAQKAANAARKAGTTKVARPHVIVVRSGPAKNKGAKRVHTPRVHTVESVAKQAADRAAVIASDMAFKALMAKYKEDKAILRAKKAAQRKLWIELRAEKVARICAKLWMEKGVWVDRFLAEACNDACYEIRTSAMTELLALVGVAA